MKAIRWFVAAMCLVSAVTAYSQTSTIFNLRPLLLSNGWRITGTITTDGAVGVLSAGNIVDWHLTVVQTTDFVWTEKDSSDLNITGVSTDGKKIFVSTSPDGVQDGGTLNFSRSSGLGQIPTSAILADFTQLSTNLGYIGGMAGWQDEIWGLNFVGLNQRNRSRYRAALAVAGQPNVFRVSVPIISSTPLQMTMFGTVTTDGTIGTLLPQNIIAWNITARNQDITDYTKANSVVLSAFGVSSDGANLKVDHTGGQFTIGISGPRPTFVTLADFSDPAYSDGFANYYLGNFGVMGEKFPLTGPHARTYVVARQ